MAVQEDRRKKAGNLLRYTADLLKPIEPGAAGDCLSLADQIDPGTLGIGAATEPPPRRSEYDIGHATGREDRQRCRPRLGGKALEFYGKSWRDGYLSGYSADVDAQSDATGAAA